MFWLIRDLVKFQTGSVLNNFYIIFLFGVYYYFFLGVGMSWRWRLTNWRIAGNNSIQLPSDRAKVLITKQQGGVTAGSRRRGQGWGWGCGTGSGCGSGPPATSSVFQLQWTNQARGRPTKQKAIKPSESPDFGLWKPQNQT